MNLTLQPGRVAGSQFVLPVQSQLPRLPVLAPVPEAEALHARLVAPASPRCHALLEAMRRHPAASLDGGLMMGVLGSALESALSLSNSLRPLVTGVAVNAAAQAEAAALVASAFTTYHSEAWSPLISASTVDTSRAPHVVRVDLDPGRLNALSADERTTLLQRMVATFPESVRKLLPFVRVDLDGSLQAARLHAPGKVWRAAVASTAATVLTVGGAFGAGIVGIVPGMVVGGLAAGAVALWGGVIAALAPGLSSGSMASETFYVTAVGVAAMSGVVGLVGTPIVCIKDALRSYRDELKSFREQAAPLVVLAIESSRSLLPTAWQSAIGGIVVGRDQRGHAVVDIAAGLAGKAPGGAAELSQTIAAVLPEPLRRLLGDVPIRYPRAQQTLLAKPEHAAVDAG